jgi:hypothetical protein
MAKPKRAGWVTYRGDVGVIAAAGVQRSTNRYSRCRLSARESQTLVNFGPALARWLPPNTLGPNTARRAGHLLAPPGIERDDAAMSSTATGTRSRWFPLPHKPISVGAEALTTLLWAACLVSRRGAVDR